MRVYDGADFRRRGRHHPSAALLLSSVHAAAILPEFPWVDTIFWVNDLILEPFDYHFCTLAASEFVPFAPFWLQFLYPFSGRMPLTDYENVSSNGVRAMARSFKLRGDQGKIGVWWVVCDIIFGTCYRKNAISRIILSPKNVNFLVHLR